MLVKDYITDEAPRLKETDTGEQALMMMELFKLSHLPVVREGAFIGLISEEEIYDQNIPKLPLNQHVLASYSPFIDDEQHIYSVLELVTKMNLSLVPVVNNLGEYLGEVLASNLLQVLAHSLGIIQNGGMIMISISPENYQLSEIAKIVEDNNARILSATTLLDVSNKLEVTLKINIQDVTAVVKSFERYNYTIIKFVMLDSKLDDVLQDRYESLMNYLEV